MARSILIVDDDEPFLDFVTTAVHARYPSLGVLVARNGKEALDVVHGVAPPGLVLTDIKMPRLDGIGLCKSLRAAYRGEMKIVAMSANEDAGTKGFDAVLAKPFSIDALFRVIDEYVGSKGEE
nr:response regulator [Candidatus Sigynarchaeota archaeon]